MRVRYSNMAARTISWIILFVVLQIALVISVGIISEIRPSDEITGLLAFLAVTIAVHLGLRISLPKNLRLYRLGLFYDEERAPLAGGAYMRLGWGLLWRWFVVAFPTPFINQFLHSSSFVQFIIWVVTGFFATLWLYRHQLGSLTIAGIESDVEYIPRSRIDGEDAGPLTVERTFTTAIASILGVSVTIGFFLVGLVSLAAIFTFFEDYWGWWWIFAGIGSMFLSYIPLLGSIAGFYAATEVWGWSTFWSFVFFFFPVILFLPLMLLEGISGAIRRFTHRNS